ncbi:MAG: ABC transporter permease [Candidatus Cyclobacteriaceae bacterium M2_1C_046]
MDKLLAAITKDVRILTRDRIGLLLMFIMPILLVIVITSLQNNTFELVNEHKVPLVVYNEDQDPAGAQLAENLRDMGMFNLVATRENFVHDELQQYFNNEDVLVSIVIPENFTESIASKSEQITHKALMDFGLAEPSDTTALVEMSPLLMYYNPVLQENYKLAIHGAITSALKMVENKQMLNSLYTSLSESNTPPEMEENMIIKGIGIREVAVTKDGSGVIPNATQHNVPAWTVFAMFFIVTSLGSNIVSEKISGSFIRLKTMPTGYYTSLLSKQLTYIAVTFLQVVVIFTIGILLFPVLGLPKLNLPDDILALALVSILCGWCAVSYAMLIGVYAETQEQANGFGAVSVVILAAIGGILVPAFAMPESFKMLLLISPLHWCLEAYYDLFLERGNLPAVLINLARIIIVTIIFQALAIYGLKRKNLI